MRDDAPLPTDIVVRTDPPPRRFPEDAATAEQREEARGANQLDSPAALKLHDRLLSFYQLELERQADNRAEMATDEDFYDSIQWDADDAETLRERGQTPLVYNVIATSINWILGTEKRGRADFKILPRTAEDGKTSERKTALLKYLSDVNRTPFSRSLAFTDAAKAGVGWMEDGWDPETDGEAIYSRCETWRNMLWDSSATAYDLSDARYVFRSKWVDVDLACSWFEDRKHPIRAASTTSLAATAEDDFGDWAMDAAEEDKVGVLSRATLTNARHRVRIIEAWYVQPEQVPRMSGGMFNGEIYDEYSRGHAAEIAAGRGRAEKKRTMRMRVAIMTSDGLLYEGPSPYRHNRFPFTPIWCFRRGRDKLPYGFIRSLRDIQMDVNKRASKSLHILSTNKVVMEAGALPDDVTMDEFAEEVAKPDGIIVHKKGYQITLNADRDLAQWHLELMSRSISMIQQVGGITDENLGRRTNASSGIAIERRQQQGSMATTGIFDNLRLATQIQGEKQLSLIEQFMDERRQFRITNSRGGPEFVVINDGEPDNDVVRSKADFIIGESDWRASMRQAAADQLLEAAKYLPQPVVAAILDLLVEHMDLPNREEIVKRIRAINGQRDPDADPNAPPSPEEAQRMQAAGKQQALAEAEAQLTLRGLAAKAARDEATAQRTTAQTVLDNIAAQMQALQAAVAALTTPAAVPVADYTLSQSGFVSQTDREDATHAAANAQQEQQAAQAAAARQQQAAQQPADQPAPAAPSQQ